MVNLMNDEDWLKKGTTKDKLDALSGCCGDWHHAQPILMGRIQNLPLHIEPR